MTVYHIKAPHTLNVAINLPASKSISNRALIINALCKFPKPIGNLSDCDDTNVVIKALNERKGIIDAGAAGTAMRFLTAYFAGQQGDYIITGTERMKNRPVRLLVDALRTLGAQIDYLEKEGFPPLRIVGQTLKGGDIEIDGSISSQYISALLMTAPAMTCGLRLHLVGRIASTPYIDMTIRLMRQFGVTVRREGHTFVVPPQQYVSIDNFKVEPDWSAASYWYEMVALCSDRDASVTLYGLHPDSLQGDAKIVSLFDMLGVRTIFTADGIKLSKKQQTSDGFFQFDFNAIPDMAQTVAVTCVMLQIPFRFTGLQSLKIKETDRLSALRTELSKLGFPLEIHDDNTLERTYDDISQSIHCDDFNKTQSGNRINQFITTYDDHRMAMAFAPVSLCSRNGVSIAHPEVVSKSYPLFWDDLRKANFLISCYCEGKYKAGENGGFPEQFQVDVVTDS